MKNICSMLMLAGLATTAHAAEFIGVITDTMCGAKHTMMKNHADDQCVTMCAKGQYGYALFDGTNVLKLSDPKTAPKFAAQRVKVTGTLDSKTNTIRVAGIQLAKGK